MGDFFKQKGFQGLQPESQFLFVSHIIWRMQSKAKVSKTFFVAAAMSDVGGGGGGVTQPVFGFLLNKIILRSWEKNLVRRKPIGWTRAVGALKSEGQGFKSHILDDISPS